jgi:aryl-alcohol dehydrogenase-like predicted oxidoreductase
MAKLAIGWPFGRKFVSAVIIGVRSVRQLEANLEAGDWNLPPGPME